MGFKVMFLGLVNYILKPDRQLLSRTDVEVTSCSVARGEAAASPIPFSPWCFEKKRLLNFFFNSSLFYFFCPTRSISVMVVVHLSH